MGVRKTVSFAGTCEARSEVVLVSKRIMRPFRTKRLHVHFPTGTQNLVALSFHVSGDDEAPSSEAPSGVSLLQDYGQVDYVRGEGVTLVLEHEVEVAAGGMWLKVRAVNSDFYEHAVDVQMEIEVEDTC